MNSGRLPLEILKKQNLIIKLLMNKNFYTIIYKGALSKVPHIYTVSFIFIHSLNELIKCC